MRTFRWRHCIGDCAVALSHKEACLSSTALRLWPKLTRSAIMGLGLCTAAALQAQDNNTAPTVRETTSERTVIDILADADQLYGPPPPMEDCSDEQEAAIISGEIIVCRRRRDQREYRTTDPDSAEDRYARETAFANDPQAPDVAGEGIFRGPATVSGMCFIPPCPKEAALFIDVEALPEAPPGSDADRIARGLPLLGDDQGTPPSEAELGLPSARKSGEDSARPEASVSPEESEAPVEEP